MPKLSPLELMLQIKKEKREEEKARQKQVAENQNRVNDLRQANEQRFANMLGTPQANLANSVAEGLRAGMSEAQVQRQANLAEAKAYVEKLQADIAQAIREEEKGIAGDKWMKQNQNALGQIVNYFPQMRPEQAKRALEPLIEDLGNTMQEKIRITDVNTMNGILSFQKEDGSIMQRSLYDLFPALKSRYLLNQGMNDAGFYSDEQLMKQAQGEYDDEQAVINREQQRLDRRENREDEKWAYQKRTMDNQRLQQDQMSEELPENWNAEKENDYTNHKKEYIKQNPTITKENNDFIGLADGIKNEVIPSIKRLVEIRNNMKAMMGNNKFSWVSSSPGEFAEKLREGIAGGEPVKTFLSSLTDVGEEERQMIKNIYNVSKQIYMPLYARYADVVLGKGVRSDKDMQIFKNMLTSLFQSDEGFNASINEMKAMINGSLKTVNSKIARNKDLISEAYLDRNQFNERYYGNR